MFEGGVRGLTDSCNNPETIYKLLASRNQAPKEMQALLDMASRIHDKNSFPAGLDFVGLMKAFSAHIDTVKSTIPAHQLLVYKVKDGWPPLCHS